MYTYKYPHPAVTADCIVLAPEDGTYKVLLVQRGNEPYKGCWAFPGGFINIDESADDAARRELHEETGLSVDDIVQVGAYSEVDRDPRERVITIAYLAEMEAPAEVRGGDDAAEAKWFDVNNLPELAFDHKKIMKAAWALHSVIRGLAEAKKS